MVKIQAFKAWDWFFKGVIFLFTVGMDMVEISRIKRSAENKRFLKFIFSEKELAEHTERNFNLSSIAAAFCAKEAFAKAVGTGFRGFGFKDVQVFHDSLGKPYISLSGKAEELFSKDIKSISLSLTHTKNYAAGVVLCERIS